MTSFPQPRSPVKLETVELESVRLYTVEFVDEYVAARITKNLKIAEDRDAFEFRRAFTGFGKVAHQTLRCPSSLFQHLKLALRERLPRVFGRLAVHFDEVSIDGGVLLTGLKDKVEDRKAARLVIPYVAPPARRQYLSDPSNDEDS